MLLNAYGKEPKEWEEKKKQNQSERQKPEHKTKKGKTVVSKIRHSCLS